MFPGNTSLQPYQAPRLPPPPVAHTQSPPGYNEIDKRFNNLERSQNSLEKVMRTMAEQLSQLVLANREKGTFPSQTEPNPNVGTSSMRPPVQDNVKRVNAITSLRSGRLIDHKLEDLVDVPVQFSPPLSPPFPPENDSASRDATHATPTDLSPSQSIDPVNSEEIKKDESKKGDDTSPPSTVERVHKPTAPFPLRLRNKKDQTHVDKIRETFSQVKINIPLLDAIQQMPPYAKFLKELCTTKRMTNVPKKAFLASNVSSIISCQIPAKYKDPGCPTISIVIGDQTIHKALLDLGASVNLLPYSVYETLGLGELKPTRTILQLADHSTRAPRGIVEDVLIKVGEFIYPVDFVVLETESVANSEIQIPVILGRPFLATSNALINCRNGMLKLSFGNMTVELNIFNLQRQHAIFDGFDTVNWLDVYACDDSYVDGLIDNDICDEIDPLTPNSSYSPSFAHTPDPVLELKPLPGSLKYVFLGPNETLPVIIASNLIENQENKLLKVLKEHKEAIGWTLGDIKGISPAIVRHRIHLEENGKPYRDHQRRLNPTLQEVVKKEVIKWLDHGIIYPISDSEWVSPVQIVPKKTGITVVRNDKNELVPTRVQSGWRVCIDYRKLNAATRKDHFPLPFIDQMLERLAGHSYYCFLDGYSGYTQVSIAPEDQDKTIFKCLFGTFAFRRMPFGLCNAPATF